MGLRWAGDKKLPKQPGASSGLARWSLGLGLHSGQERGSERRDPLATELREVACSLTPPDPQKHQFHGTPIFFWIPATDGVLLLREPAGSDGQGV